MQNKSNFANALGIYKLAVRKLRNSIAKGDVKIIDSLKGNLVYYSFYYYKGVYIVDRRDNEHNEIAVRHKHDAIKIINSFRDGEYGDDKPSTLNNFIQTILDKQIFAECGSEAIFFSESEDEYKVILYNEESDNTYTYEIDKNFKIKKVIREGVWITDEEDDILNSENCFYDEYYQEANIIYEIDEEEKQNMYNRYIKNVL